MKPRKSYAQLQREIAAGKAQEDKRIAEREYEDVYQARKREARRYEHPKLYAVGHGLRVLGHDLRKAEGVVAHKTSEYLKSQKVHQRVHKRHVHKKKFHGLTLKERKELITLLEKQDHAVHVHHHRKKLRSMS